MALRERLFAMALALVCPPGFRANMSPTPHQPLGEYRRHSGQATTRQIGTCWLTSCFSCAFLDARLAVLEIKYHDARILARRRGCVGSSAPEISFAPLSQLEESGKAQHFTGMLRRVEYDGVDDLVGRLMDEGLAFQHCWSISSSHDLLENSA